MNRRLILATALIMTACSGVDTGPVAETTAASDAPTSTTPTAPTEGDLTTAAPGFDLDAQLADYVGEAEGGVAVLTVRNGETTVAAVGAANSSGDQISPEMPFRVGSIAKPFIATMILQMVDEGSIELDRPLGDYLPETQLAATTTVRSLLSHQTGIPNYTDQPTFFSDVLADISRSFTTGEILDYVVDAEAGAPGEFSYSNTNYILLGQLIEHIDDTSLNDSLQRRIAEPLGLTATAAVGRGVANPEGLVGGWSFGTLSGAADAEYESIASSAWAAGALVSTVTDLEMFLTALFAGKLISPDGLAAMTDTGTTGYGLGLFDAQLGPGNPGYAHNGSIPGYSAIMGISPDSGDTIVILTNNDQIVADRLAPQILMNW